MVLFAITYCRSNKPVPTPETTTESFQTENIPKLVLGTGIPSLTTCTLRCCCIYVRIRGVAVAIAAALIYRVFTYSLHKLSKRIRILTYLTYLLFRCLYCYPL